MPKLNPEEKIAWDELYQYVRSEVMGYDINQALSKNMVLRLKGLACGKTIANNRITAQAKYSFRTILNTFKYCCSNISYAKEHKDFKDESGKFMYFCAIVENKINDVYLREQNAKTIAEKADLIDIVTNDTKADYVTKSSESNNQFNEMW